MEIFFRVLQGAYAYLLIFQILIVSSLVLVLLWLIVRRTREAASELAAAEQTYSSSASASAGAESGLASSGELEEIKKKLVEAESETAKSKKELAESKSLSEKVKYLESKLLEYEILQEEIGTLSTLKVENEELKKKVVSLESASASMSQAPRIESGELHEPTFDSAMEKPLIFDTPMPGQVVGISTNETPTAAASNQDNPPPELESLLQQIDALTQAPQSQPPDKTA